MKTTLPVPVRWRLAGGATVLLFLLLVARFWHPVYGFSSFFQVAPPNDELKINAFRALPVYVHREAGGYDGLYYAQIAQDPSLRSPELPRAMDNFAYRARRILPPAVAWLSGFGQPAGIVLTYSLINVAAWLALAALLWRLLAVRDARGWLAWAGLLFSAGTLSSVRLALTDLSALVLLAAAILAAERWRGRLAVVLLAAAGLARETALLGVAGLCKPPWISAKNLARLALVAAPLAIWLAYVRWRVGPADPGWANFTWPGAGLFEKWRQAWAATSTITDKTLAWTTVLATFALSVQGFFFAAHVRLADRWWRVGAAYAMMMVCLGTAVWEGFPGAATRVLLPLHLAFNVRAHRCGAHWAWLALGNLAVFSGLLAIRDVPHDGREIAALRSGGVACVARAGEGWHAREEHGRHVWFWTAHRGTVAIEGWTQRSVPVELRFRLRAIAPCSVTIAQAGREIGRMEASPSFSDHTVLLTVESAASELEFATDTPPRPENTSPGAREIAFALYDPRLAMPER